MVFLIVTTVSVICYLAFYLYKFFSYHASVTKYDEYVKQKYPLPPLSKKKIVDKRDAKHLFSPLKITDKLTLQNRIIKSATFESMCPNGKVTNELIKFHLQQSKYIGMTTVSYGCVSVEGRTFPNQLLINENTFFGLKRLCTAIHQQDNNNNNNNKVINCKISMQLTHAGMMAEPIDDSEHRDGITGDSLPPGKIYSPSRMWSWAAFQFTNELTLSQINILIEKYINAAEICYNAGFDAVEIHCGHGYLISQFLSLLTNNRNNIKKHGRYNNLTIQGRCQFAIDIIKGIRKRIGNEFGIFIKINSHDLGMYNENNSKQHKGVTIEESVEFCKLLIEAGANVIVPTAGIILENGIFMMRGPFPLISMVKESVSWVKQIGMALVGPIIVPSIKFRKMFLFDVSVRLLNQLKLQFDEKETRLQDTKNKDRDGLDGNAKWSMAYLGGVTSLEDINKALSHGFDLVAMSRTLLREPDFLQTLKNKDVEHVSICDHQNRCIVSQMSGKPLKCWYLVDKNQSFDLTDIEDL